MEYCLQMRCRSEPIFEAVAENFVHRAETYSTLQIAKQIVAMGRLNYLPQVCIIRCLSMQMRKIQTHQEEMLLTSLSLPPQCSSQMFKKLETILSARFSQFQPRSLIEVLHACIHLERFPLNYMSKVFNPYFLQRMQGTRGREDVTHLSHLSHIRVKFSKFLLIGLCLSCSARTSGQEVTGTTDTAPPLHLFRVQALLCEYYKTHL